MAEPKRPHVLNVKLSESEQAALEATAEALEVSNARVVRCALAGYCTAQLANASRQATRQSADKAVK